MLEQVREIVTERMDKALDSLKKDLLGMRTGRASISILDGIQLDYFGTPTPLTHVATLSVPDSRQITIEPWDPKVISAIERAIQKSDIGLNPSNDGKIIRLGIPPLTEERRKDIVKQVHKRAEEAKVGIRNIRRDGNDELKKLEKEEHVSKDDTKRALEEIQKITDNHIKKIDDIVVHKQAEVMEV
ncbi:MAG: ribosome recycling factor [Nitrospira sp.]|nr:ribosome recycling factor [bacterium]MBL7048375.1 ribosome recycling factor [Nitrospira sp.]